MKLLTPLGLIALIAIPIIIIIYIIKPRYAQKKISSTSIWKKSLKFRKRNPFSWLTKSLLLAVQLALAASIAFAIATPVFGKDVEVVDHIAIIDASSSMTASKNGQTRFQRALERFEHDSGKASKHDRYSLILADDHPRVVFESEISKAAITNSLPNLTCSLASSNLPDAILLTNEIMEKNPNCEVTLYSDHAYDHQGYINVVDVSDHEYNLAISNFEYTLEGGYYAFSADIASYNAASDFKLQLDLDDGFLYQTREMSLKANETAHVTFDNLGVVSVTSANLRAMTKESSNKKPVLVEDSYPSDNEAAIYGIEKEKFRALLVGDDIIFTQAAVMAIGKADLYLRSPSDEYIPNSGFDLYIYDNYYPDAFPKDGAVIITNPPSDNSEIHIQRKDPVLIESRLEDTFSNTDVYQALMEGVTISTVNLTKYTPLNLLADFDVMATCNGSPILIAGHLGKADLIIFSFDFHFSDLPLTANMVILFRNILNYVLVPTLSNANPHIYDSINIHSSLSSVLTTLDEEVIYNENSPECDYRYECNDFGNHIVVEENSSGEKIAKRFFVSGLAEESNFLTVWEYLAPEQYQRQGNAQAMVTRADFDPVLILALILLSLALVEWGLSLNEQY